MWAEVPLAAVTQQGAPAAELGSGLSLEATDYFSFGVWVCGWCQHVYVGPKSGSSVFNENGLFYSGPLRSGSPREGNTFRRLLTSATRKYLPLRPQRNFVGPGLVG